MNCIQYKITFKGAQYIEVLSFLPLQCNSLNALSWHIVFMKRFIRTVQYHAIMRYLSMERVVNKRKPADFKCILQWNANCLNIG